MPEEAFFHNGVVAVFDAIIWATAYRLDFSWIAIPELFDEQGKPLHRQGVSSVKGLYFLGLPWLRSRSSAPLCGISRDAAWITRQLC